MISGKIGMHGKKAHEHNQWQDGHAWQEGKVHEQNQWQDGHAWQEAKDEQWQEQPLCKDEQWPQQKEEQWKGIDLPVWPGHAWHGVQPLAERARRAG